MTFGVGMPMLFPISTLYFGVMSVTEKYKLFYSNRLPPTFDTKLHMGTLVTL